MMMKIVSALLLLTTLLLPSTSTTTTAADMDALVVTTASVPQWIWIMCFVVTTIQLLRISIDFIQYVSILASRPTPTAATTTTVATTTSVIPTTTTTSSKTKYGSTNVTTTTTSTTHITPDGNNDDEEKPLLMRGSNQNHGLPATEKKSWKSWMFRMCISMWGCMAMVYAFVPWMVAATITTTTSSNDSSSSSTNAIRASVFPLPLLYTTSLTLGFEIVLYCLDRTRQRYGFVQRTLHQFVSLLLWITYAMIDLKERPNAPTLSWINIGVLILTTWYVIFTMIVGYVTKHYLQSTNSAVVHDNGEENDKVGDAKAVSAKTKKLSWSAIAILVKPYIWPDAVMGGNNTWWETSINRFRAIMTWVCVIASKYCSLISPLYLGWASTALAHQDYANCIRYSIWYNVISWMSSTFKEGQSLMYLKVKQAAYIQLSQTAFGHLHTLSLDWHLRKKLGEVLRSMDRGISACDTLMNYIFLWLVPAIAECIIVCIIFATYFHYLPLGVTVFYFVFVYVILTIVLTVWRKKFRKALVFHDNEWHDRFTDSIINFETVKFFTAERYEMERFASAVRNYQAGSVDVQASLSTLNISQQAILKACLATALSLAAIGIQKRIDCCVETVGCDSGISECCLSVSQNVCPGSKWIYRSRLLQICSNFPFPYQLCRFFFAILHQCKLATLLR